MLRSTAHSEAQKPWQKLLGPVLLAIGIFYLLFHVLSGERGVYALLKENRKLEVLQAQLASVSAKRADLEHHVRLLGPDSLDLDLLDEESRAILGTAGKDELMIPLRKSE